ncbi:hypothetical protein FSARC_5405 [Fusarium sarcochroum]|uniref:Aminoglycoside phosphotransferase domain-containing protein n=1 Tax=Fusarium sarcochroum TaxID=1208366 RepID=A0A8H4TZF6_9HYPO|nr:hypothetical protein FSARC_5405 [Fusarium sarcochroum]
MSHNHINYEGRLAFVRGLLKDKFDINGETEITPIQYNPEVPFKFNSFIYSITLPSGSAPKTTPEQDGLKPGCVAIPSGTRDFILRLTNSDAEGMSPTNRVENEVAAISLASAALEASYPRIVPSVYAWNSTGNKSHQGWILEEWMRGSQLDEAFEAMDLNQKRNILSQMAGILKALQEAKLPNSFTGIGGLSFDEKGRIVSAVSSISGLGPWSSYQESFKNQLDDALEKADASQYIRGWRANGVRDRLDRFIEQGVQPRFEALDSKDERILVHGDFTTNNILFDPSSGRITALLDYDFSCVSHSSYEFLQSLSDVQGQFKISTGDGTEETTLTHAKLHGFSETLPETTGDVQWELAKALENELEKAGVKRPRTIEGIDKIAEVHAVLQAALPWRLSNADILNLQSEKAILDFRGESEQGLMALLDRLGF